ncbi:hypothetical protein MBANPS3_009913 [Mucor bainieri]
MYDYDRAGFMHFLLKYIKQPLSSAHPPATTIHMVNFNSLPYEIQRLIFQQVDTTRQLGQCRLVCKSWDTHAECAMFSRTLHITEHNTTSIYNHLWRNPELANRIKEISLDCRFTIATAHLLQLAMRPSIERIVTPNFEKPKALFYETMADIIQQSEVKFQRLKGLPWPSSSTDTHYKTLLLLKESLEELHLYRLDNRIYHKISTQLQEFKNLSKLSIYCTFDDLDHVESVFRGAPHLKELTLGNCSFREDTNWSKQYTLDWMKQHVEISQNALTLKATPKSDHNLNLMEYLLFKYPNITHFHCNLKKLFSNNGTIGEHLSLGISTIPKYTITMGAGSTWKRSYELFVGDKNVVKLFYKCRNDNRLNRNQVSGESDHNQKRTSEFVFCINYHRYALPHSFNSHANFLKTLGAFTTSVYIDCVSYRAKQAIGSLTAFKALEVMGHLEDMKLVLHELRPVTLKLSTEYKKRVINTLEIIGATIQPSVFRRFGHLLHTINTLTLSSCHIISETRLGKLCIIKKSTHNEIALSHSNTYLMLNLHQDPTLYFMVKPSCNDIHQISFNEYADGLEDTPSFAIQCQLIASIELKLGDICANIDVRKYCELPDVASDELNI